MWIEFEQVGKEKWQFSERVWDAKKLREKSFKNIDFMQRTLLKLASGAILITWN